jgi:hypothetical protein
VKVWRWLDFQMDVFSEQSVGIKGLRYMELLIWDG